MSGNIKIFFAIMAISVLFLSCEYEKEREQAVIIDVTEQSTVMGVAWKTTIECNDGSTTMLEGKFGNEGDTIWVTRMTSMSDSSVKKIIVE